MNQRRNQGAILLCQGVWCEQGSGDTQLPEKIEYFWVAAETAYRLTDMPALEVSLSRLPRVRPRGCSRQHGLTQVPGIQLWTSMCAILVRGAIKTEINTSCQYGRRYNTCGVHGSALEHITTQLEINERFLRSEPKQRLCNFDVTHNHKEGGQESGERSLQQGYSITMLFPVWTGILPTQKYSSHCHLRITRW